MPFHLYGGRDQTFAPRDVATDYVAIGIRTGTDGTREDVRQIVEQPQPQFAIEGTTTFSPTFWLDGVLSTDIGLDLGLVGTLDLLKLGATASVGGVDVLSFSSLSLNDLLQIDNTLFSERPVNLLMIWEAIDMVLILVVAGGGRCRLMTNEEVHLPCQTEVSFR